MRNPSTSFLQNKMRGDGTMIRQGQDLSKAQGLPSTHGKRDLSILTPIDDRAGNTGYLGDRFTHTGTANVPEGETAPNQLADRATYWMVGTEGNAAAQVEWVRVQRSDGQYRFYPTVAF